MSRGEKINILLITADQFRADCLSAAGHPTVRTPALDALAEESARFARHFGQCPPCGPSRASLLTGMYQMNHRSVRNGTPLDAGFTNLAELVRQAGYEPWLIGYTDTTRDPRGLHPDDPRLASYEEVLPGMRQYAPGSEKGLDDSDWQSHLRQLGYANWRTPYEQLADYPGSKTRGPTFAPIRLKAEHSDTAYTTDRAIRFINQYRGTPWFLHLSYLRPHPPFVAPEPWHDLYKPEDVPDFVALPSLEAERALHPFIGFRFDHPEIEAGLSRDRPPNDNVHWRQARATYYGLISELDDNLGRFFAAMKQLGVYDRTLIIFTADHGEMLGDHWWWGKEVPFDKAVHVPLIIRSPMARAAGGGRVAEAFTEHIDIVPTILDHLRIEPPLQCDGRSLVPFLEGTTPSRWRQEAHWEFDFRDVATGEPERRFGITLDECNLAVVRSGTEKYIHFSALPPLYFDLAKDPGELRNLASEPESAAAILAMAQRMLNWRLVYGRRELTGISQREGERHVAARERRIT
jgi:arylsulfatase A-like enzyme